MEFWTEVLLELLMELLLVLMEIVRLFVAQQQLLPPEELRLSLHS